MQPATSRPVDLQLGAHAYRQLLAGAGGSEIETLERSALCVAMYDAPPYDLQVPALPVSRLSVNLTGARVSGALAGARARGYEARRHSLFLTPASADARWRKEAASRHVNIYFHAEALGAGSLAPLLNAMLPGVRAIADELAAELQRDDPLAAEAVDSLARLLLVRVMRHGRASQPLTPRDLARVREFVLAHLCERILVADLAAVVGLSPQRYAQAHARLTGQSPHQFVLALRLAQATELLAHSALGLADIAAACGFASQQHLTHTMRRRLGSTPARWRRSQGG